MYICFPEHGNRETEESISYGFYGWENANVPVLNDGYKGIGTPCDLYDILLKIWCKYSCAPRLREEWTADNPTLGQCSITAFLVQDIFGGKVKGIRLKDGNYHCYNVVGDSVFDLTSEQFKGEKLVYSPDDKEQLREEHFGKEEKLLRYEFLKDRLRKYTEG